MFEIEAFNEVRHEIFEARREHDDFNSAHEGYAVILEELDELKAEVFKKKGSRVMSKMREEAREVAAMAIRFMVDIT